MSSHEKLLTQELSCPICLQLFQEAVVLPCGHNYCRLCIQQHCLSWGDESRPRCPECREEYGGVDDLRKNFKLCSIIEGYLAEGERLNAPEGGGVTEGVTEGVNEGVTGASTAVLEVHCDQCLDGTTAAVKTCLRCEVSLCSRHLQRHSERASSQAHLLVEPRAGVELQGSGPYRPIQVGQAVLGCALHRCPLEFYCSNDRSLLCTDCFRQGTHQGHEVVTLDVARQEMRGMLEKKSELVSCRLQMTESMLKQVAEDQSTMEEVEDRLISQTGAIMESLAGLVDRHCEHVRACLEEDRGVRRASWKAGLSRLEEQRRQLQDAQRSAGLALSETDPGAFIQRVLQADAPLSEASHGPLARPPSKTPVPSSRLQAEVRADAFHAETTRLLDSLRVLLVPPELTFDPLTAHPTLLLSGDLRTVRRGAGRQAYPEHPERFASAPQVLCSQGFSSGRRCWVVEVGEPSMWSVGLCYRTLPRRGDHSRLGHNAASWRLQWKNGKLTACHASSSAALPTETANQPLRLEVALDYEGGTLAFSSTKGRRELLHTFRATFRETVYPAFSIHSSTAESWISLQGAA